MKEKVAERIRITRLSKNLSQQNMADELDLTPAAYSNIERGITDITVSRLFEIAAILDTDPVFFIQDPKAEDPDNLYRNSVTQQLILVMQQMQQYQKQIEQIQEDINRLRK